MSHPFKHFHTVCVHRRRVIANGAHMGIFWHCLRHDLSKFSYTEFHESAKYYTGDHSPVRGDRMAHHGFSLITQHHVGRNKHHWQYWVDFEAGRLVVMTMPWKYASEMICDMLSAAKTYHPRECRPDSALLYFERLKSLYDAGHFFLFGMVPPAIRHLGLEAPQKEGNQGKIPRNLRRAAAGGGLRRATPDGQMVFLKSFSLMKGRYNFP